MSTPKFVAVNINSVPDRPDLVSCQIIDRDHIDTPGYPCVDVLAISPETLELWDRIQHEASLYRSVVKLTDKIDKHGMIKKPMKPEEILKSQDELKGQ